MEKMLYINSIEIDRYRNLINKLRNDVDIIRKDYNKILTENNFLKNNGDEILVIVKDINKNNVYEYRSTEKELLTNLVSENYIVREKYDNIIREKENIENQRQIILMKSQDMINQYNNKITELTQYIDWLENRDLISRISNKLKSKMNNSFQNNDYDLFMIKKIEENIETIKSEDIKLIDNKPRGWHFKKVFIDSDGNVYHKGILQLKKD